MATTPQTGPAEQDGPNDRDAGLYALLASRKVGAVATIKRDGRPQLSNVSYTYDPATREIRVSITDSRAKTANLRRDPRASLLATSPDGWSYVVAEGVAILTPVATDPHDSTVDDLVRVYRAIGGEHPDWEDYRRAMVADRRLVLTIPVDRVYGLVR
jgi:PPOX class probable F420-dependent enzyme